MADLGFTKKEAVEIVGMAARAIQYYTERMLVMPEIDQAGGKGSQRLYSKKNLVELSIIKRLSDYMISFPIVKQVMNLLRNPIPYCTSDGSMHVDREGIIGSWQDVEDSAYILLFKRVDGEFLPVFGGKNAVTDPMFLDVSESVLIIDFGRIVKKIKAL